MAAQCAAMPKKEPWMALTLSLLGGFVSGLFIGLGQLYNGQVKKAVILSVAHIVLVFGIFFMAIFACLLTFGLGLFCCMPVMLVPFALWVYALYDAYTTAEKINKGEPAKDWLD